MTFGSIGRAVRGWSPQQDRRYGWVLIVVALGFAFTLLAGRWAVDLTALYFAAHFFSSGDPALVYVPGPEVFLYDPPPAWRALEAAAGMPDGPLTPYLYPPLWAALLSPVVAKVSPIGFFTAFHLVNLAALAGMIWLAYRLARPARFGFFAWSAVSLALVLTSGVGVMGLWLGQPQILVSFVTLCAFVLLAEKRDIGAGAVLALAAAMKLTPALLVVVFVMERRWRALVAFTIAGAVLALASVWLAGWPMHAAFLDKLSLIEGGLLVSRIVASLELAFHQLGAVLTGSANWRIDHPYMVPEPGWIAVATRATLVAGLVLSWASTRRLAARPRLWARVFTVVLVSLVTGPLPWIHYLIATLVLLPGLFLLVPARQAVFVIALTGIALSLPLFLAMSHHPDLGFAQAGLHLGVALGLYALVIARARRAG